MLSKLTHSKLAAALFQAALMLVMTLAAVLLPLLLLSWNAALKIALQWIMLPLCGAFSAGLLAYSGVTCYAAWILPPVIMSALPWLFIGFPLSPGIMLLCAFESMIGAAAGDVAHKRAH